MPRRFSRQPSAPKPRPVRGIPPEVPSVDPALVLRHTIHQVKQRLGLGLKTLRSYSAAKLITPVPFRGPLTRYSDRSIEEFRRANELMKRFRSAAGVLAHLALEKTNGKPKSELAPVGAPHPEAWTVFPVGAGVAIVVATSASPEARAMALRWLAESQPVLRPQG